MLTFRFPRLQAVRSAWRLWWATFPGSATQAGRLAASQLSRNSDPTVRVGWFVPLRSEVRPPNSFERLCSFILALEREAGYLLCW